MEMVFHINWIGWCILLMSGLMIGISKTGIPGVGIVAIPFVTMVIPARAATGVILPMLIFADIFAVLYYRRNAVWPHLIRLIPWAAAGIILGYLAMKKINDKQLQPVIGVVILVMLALNYLFNMKKNDNFAVPTEWWFAAVLGLLAGVTTMMANAAGPILIIYLLAMRLPKVEFIGTGAWYFFLLNWFKVPFSVNLGLINAHSLILNLAIFPSIAVGAFLGIFVLKRIPEKVFSKTIQILAAAAAIKLLF